MRQAYRTTKRQFNIFKRTFAQASKALGVVGIEHEFEWRNPGKGDQDYIAEIEYVTDSFHQVRLRRSGIARRMTDARVQRYAVHEAIHSALGQLRLAMYRGDSQKVITDINERLTAQLEEALWEHLSSTGRRAS